MNELLTVKEVAGCLKVSSRQVWKLIASGRLPQPMRLGRSVRWRGDDLSMFVENGCNMEAFNAERAAGGVA